MPSLKSEPAGHLRSMREFFALAGAMEKDATSRYIETARQLRQQNAGRLADVFEELSQIEQGHVRQVEQWADHYGTDASAEEAPWSIPDTFDASPDEVAQSKLMTPYRALASAVRHEQRSFAFWAYVAAHAEGEVKDAAERMALEELEHVSLLRKERRMAYHNDRRDAVARDVTLSALAATERHIADLIEQHAGPVPGVEPIASLAMASKDAAVKLEALGKVVHPKFSTPGVPAGRENDIASLAEYLAEAYLRLAETSRNELVLSLAQELAKSAIYRLGAVAAPL